MELRYAKPDDDIRGLWRTVFPGDDGGSYFERDYPDAGVLVYYDGGKTVSMLHFIIKTMLLWNREVSCAYILGIGTHPDYRGRGLAGDLVEQALFELHLRSVSLACLIPAEPSLAGFYEKYGFYQAGARMRPPEQKKEYPRASEADIEGLDALYEAMTKGYAHIKRTRDCWKTILMEYDVGYMKGAGYSVFDDGTWMEGTGGAIGGGHPNAACIRVIEAKYLAELAHECGRPVPQSICDDYCPWNGADESPDAVSAEKFWFSGDEPYVNLLYNGKDAETW